MSKISTNIFIKNTPFSLKEPLESYIVSKNYINDMLVLLGDNENIVDISKKLELSRQTIYAEMKELHSIFENSNSNDLSTLFQTNNLNYYPTISFCNI